MVVCFYDAAFKIGISFKREPHISALWGGFDEYSQRLSDFQLFAVNDDIQTVTLISPRKFTLVAGYPKVIITS